MKARLQRLAQRLQDRGPLSLVRSARYLAPQLPALAKGDLAESLASLKRHTAERAMPAGDALGRVDYFGNVAVGAATIGARALSPDVQNAALDVVKRLDPDDYLAYVTAFVDRGRRLGGDDWRYADIMTAVHAATELVRPTSYLEIGVRRGRSMALVAAGSPTCAILGIDLWIDPYVGMDNPGPDFVRAEMAKLGHTGSIELLSGDSHRVLPRLFLERPSLTFDLITVDGDHSHAGAERDLRDVLPRLRIGGALVFDDVCMPGLARVWDRTVARSGRYSTWTFDDIGYGVAVAVRRN